MNGKHYRSGNLFGMLLAEAPVPMSDHDLLMTILLITAAILLVVVGGIVMFAQLARRERSRREKDIEAARAFRNDGTT